MAFSVQFPSNVLVVRAPHFSRKSNSSVVLQANPTPPPVLWTAAGGTPAQAAASAQLTTWKLPGNHLKITWKPPGNNLETTWNPPKNHLKTTLIITTCLPEMTDKVTKHRKSSTKTSKPHHHPKTRFSWTSHRRGGHLRWWQYIQRIST